VKVVEIQRKVSSCPHLFAWNGSHIEFVSDFGGMGGLGYLTAPGVYAPPDSTEYVPVLNLQSKDNEYVLYVVEPIEEVVFLDEASLIAVDHPKGTRIYPNEMMAVNAAPPDFEVFCIEDAIAGGGPRLCRTSRARPTLCRLCRRAFRRTGLWAASVGAGA